MERTFGTCPLSRPHPIYMFELYDISNKNVIFNLIENEIGTTVFIIVT